MFQDHIILILQTELAINKHNQISGFDLNPNLYVSK